ncbi:alpha-glucosidase [Altererythrobacter sp. H2]|uniref:alpha-glucosidase n=1 Tax=Altererythrobacter sp. H2 TaxID=3108391 RepID=UPI002B4BB794|nr:alpha-glucosidase [Altererythrobacter sp. H2]WRK94994.1 alpha-glucosidase [Altererythrobacter sp. H2]
MSSGVTRRGRGEPKVLELRVREEKDGFELHFGGRVLLAHRADSPALALAHGNPDVAMVRGNFRMADAPVSAPVLQVCQRGPDGTVRLGVGESDAILSVEADQARSAITFRAADSFDRMTIDFALGDDEVLWGGGEQMSYLALNGRKFPVWTSEPGVGREPGSALTDLASADGSFAGGDYWTTNYPEPTVLSSAGWALSLGNPEYCELDCTAAGRLRLHVWAGAVSITLYQGNPASLVQQLGARFGPRQPLPQWALGGAVVGLKDGARSFERLEQIIEAGAAVSGLWCEDWVGVRQTSFGRRLFWDWQWNADRYPDLPARIAALKARGIRFLGYVNPYLAVDGPLYPEAAERGYFARRLDSDEPYLVDFGEFDAGVVDFTNPAAADWFAEEVIGKRMLDFGLDGWMADFGEYLPVDLRLFDGDPMQEHNRWPVRWAEVNRRAVASRGREGDVLWFMRAGHTGVHAHCPLLWAGDQSVDFSRHDGIGTVITAALSSGLVGNAFSHSDVGGYTSLFDNVRTEELLLRWYELGAFSPVMRTHEGNRPDDNLQIDSTPQLLAAFARWSRVHATLAPYVAHLVAEAQATGLPAQRALFLHYPDDRDTFTIQDQFLYGEDLMVAPVIEQGAVSRRVYLPGKAGQVWRHVWSGADRAPGWHEVAAPIGQPPAFFRPESRFAALFGELPK